MLKTAHLVGAAITVVATLHTARAMSKIRYLWVNIRLRSHGVRQEAHIFPKYGCYWILAILTTTIAQPLHAEVKIYIEKASDRESWIWIYGTITRADAAKVSAAMREMVPKPSLPHELKVSLDSRGGEVEAAMAIGRLLRTKITNTDVSIPLPPLRPIDGREYADCASACILILVAGSDRTVALGRVGIHRPYSTGSVKAGTDTRAAYRVLTTQVKAYLEEMAMPGRLYDEMMQVPPEDIRWISSSERSGVKELHDLGIVGKDPAYDDSQDSIAASARGISKQEWLRRKALVGPACFHTEELVAADKSDGTGNYHRFDAFTEKFSACVKRVEDTGSP
jgi:hypothetical protein